MNVLLIDNFDSFTFNLAQLIEEAAACQLSVLQYDKVSSHVISQFDKIVISPGPGIPADFPELEHYVRQYHTSKSILGVCLGLEAIGMAFGAELTNLGRVFHGVIKPTTILKKNHYFFNGVPDRFKAGLYHSWALNEDNLSPDLEVLAKADDGVIMAVGHRDFDLVGVQFHPESYMTESGEQMIRNWLKR